jgi:hypothetical protein
MIFNEDSRVKIPCILHLVRLGYQYLSIKKNDWQILYKSLIKVWQLNKGTLNLTGKR